MTETVGSASKVTQTQRCRPGQAVLVLLFSLTRHSLTNPNRMAGAPGPNTGTYKDRRSVWCPLPAWGLEHAAAQVTLSLVYNGAVIEALGDKLTLYLAGRNPKPKTQNPIHLEVLGDVLILWCPIGLDVGEQKRFSASHLRLGCPEGWTSSSQVFGVMRLNDAMHKDRRV